MDIPMVELFGNMLSLLIVPSVFKMWTEKILLERVEKYPGLSKEDSRRYLCLCRDIGESPRFEGIAVWSGWLQEYIRI